jgi:2-amino-4-hydroxy-6-hydroxymethyldihydropteridine diphosphokinase
MAIAYLGLGSNLGDRAATLRHALAALAPFCTLLRVSSIYDTAPQLVEHQPRFLNAAVCGVTALAPHDLLRAIKRVEEELGRTPGLRYGPRVIDVDILLYDDIRLSTDALMIPHPRLLERAFALLPLAEIAPELPHPSLGSTIATLAATVAQAADVARVAPLVASTTIPYNAGVYGQAL